MSFLLTEQGLFFSQIISVL